MFLDYSFSRKGAQTTYIYINYFQMLIDQIKGPLYKQNMIK